MLRPVERLLYRVTGVDENHEMRWTEYAIAMLLFSVVSMLVLYLIQRIQGVLPFNPQNFAAVGPEHLAFNTAASFTTNTNWQAYSGETTMSYFTQMAGLAYHNFVSAAIGIALAIAFIRGIARRQMQTIGNFWVDMVRCCLWVLLPFCVVGALVLVSQGVVQNLKPYDTVKLVEPQQVQRVSADGKPVVDASGKPVMDTVATQTIAQGPVASQEIIKEWGTNGGGFFNANSAHPFENPTPLTNLFEMFCIFAIGSGLTYTLGRMTGSPAHGWAVWAAMAILFLVGVTVAYWAEARGNPLYPSSVAQHVSATQSGGNMEGKEVRFGIANSALFATVTTDASCGAINGWHDSFTPLGGMVPLVNIMLSEVIFGGVGAGMYGILIYIVLAVFIAGLMVGRTPEYLGKKIEAYDVKMAMLVSLVFPLVILTLTGISSVKGFGTSSITNPGPHGLSQILYAFVSAAGNNGSAFGGLTVNTLWYDAATGITMLVGRFFMIIPMLAIAGNLAQKKYVPPSLGTFPGHHAAVHVPADRRDSDRGRADIFPGAEPGADSGAPADVCGQDFLRKYGKPSQIGLGSEAGSQCGVEFAAQTQSTKHDGQPRHVRRRNRQRDHDRAAGHSSARGLPLQSSDHALAVVHRPVRQLRRGDGRGPRQGAGRNAAPRPLRNHGQPYRLRRKDRADRKRQTPRRGPGFVSAGELIPGDGEIVEGVASVDESAITGESAPVIREAGGDRSAVTGGTRVLSDQIKVKITSNPGETFLDRMIALVEGAARQKTPNEIALNILLAGLTIIFLLAVVTLQPFAIYSGAPQTVFVLVSLLVCLIPTTIGGLLSAIGIAGMDRLVQHNVLAMSGRAVEAAGDVNTLLLDKTGTITLGNRQATEFLPAPGVTEDEMADAAQLSSLADETPEGRSIVVLAKEKYNLRGRELAMHEAQFIPFTAQTRMSGVNLDGREIRKGAADAIGRYLDHNGTMPQEVRAIVERIASSGGTPLVVAENRRAMGVIHLKDVVKGGIRDRFAQLRAMGIRTVMITGDNPLTAAAIAREAGVDDFLAQATPEEKMKLIRSEQAGGKLVAMTGDGTNDAPALAQADVGVAMNTGTQAAKEAGNMVDLDSNPTKLIEVVEIGKQLLMTRGALTTFSIANDVAKYFAIIPAMFAATFPVLNALNIMHLKTPQSAVLSAVIFNALIIIALIPLALRGVKYRAMNAEALLRRNLFIYGVGGLIAPFVGIKIIDVLITAVGLA